MQLRHQQSCRLRRHDMPPALRLSRRWLHTPPEWHSIASRERGVYWFAQARPRHPSAGQMNCFLALPAQATTPALTIRVGLLVSVCLLAFACSQKLPPREAQTDIEASKPKQKTEAEEREPDSSIPTQPSKSQAPQTTATKQRQVLTPRHRKAQTPHDQSQLASLRPQLGLATPWLLLAGNHRKTVLATSFSCATRPITQ